MSNEQKKNINWALEKQAANEFIGLLQSSIDLVNNNKQKINSKKNQKLKILLQDLSFLAHQAKNEYGKYKTKNKQKRGRKRVTNTEWSTKEQNVKDKKRSIDNIITKMNKQDINQRIQAGNQDINLILNNDSIKSNIQNEAINQSIQDGNQIINNLLGN